MNKKSRKYRKLLFIRKKNHVRFGSKLRAMIKISGTLLVDSGLELEKIISQMLGVEVSNLEKEFRLPLLVLQVSITQIDNDFIADRWSLIITLKHGTVPSRLEILRNPVANIIKHDTTN